MEVFNRKPSYELRKVYAFNLVSEFRLIDSLIEYHPNVVINAKFPGSTSPLCSLSPCKAYELMKATIDGMQIIQFGLALSDSYGELAGNHYRGNPFGPVLYVWEFNFKDFNIWSDLYDAKSLDLLLRKGIDLHMHSSKGIESSDFAQVFMKSKLHTFAFKNWVTFQGAYDLGYLVKVLNHGRLPDSIEEFNACLRMFCGERVLDIKQMMYAEYRFVGDLEKLAQLLDVERPWGEPHQAASDCLLTALTATEMIMKKRLMGDDNGARHVGALFGLGSHLEFPRAY